MISIWFHWCHCHPIVSCFIKIQNGFTFLVPAYPGCPGKRPLNGCLSVVSRVSVSRRTFGPSSVNVHAWLAATPQLTKCVWTMAVAQHQFYLDRKQSEVCEQ